MSFVDPALDVDREWRTLDQIDLAVREMEEYLLDVLTDRGADPRDHEEARRLHGALARWLTSRARVANREEARLAYLDGEQEEDDEDGKWITEDDGGNESVFHDGDELPARPDDEEAIER